MHESLAELTEISMDGKTAGRIRCDPRLVPAPGQYLLAWAEQDLDTPLATALFSAGLCPGGFTLAPPVPAHWLPGNRLNIRGPLGKGFKLPQAARFVALATFTTPFRARRGEAPSRLLALVEPALAQNAALVLLTDYPPKDLPAAIEISPLSALAETMRWADYLALDAPRSALPALVQSIRAAAYSRDGQILVETALPCGGMGECGVCAVSRGAAGFDTHRTLHFDKLSASLNHQPRPYMLACKDGPVFDLKTLLE
jgi:hypothetical protein